MISYIRGELVALEEDKVIVDVGGVGYGIFLSGQAMGQLPPVGSKVKIHTYLNVKEDAMQLYGYLNRDALSVFKLLIGVSGIGPKVALSLLSTLPPDRLARAVADGDATALAKAPGVGKKGAQKIILELKGSIDLSQIEGSSATASTPEDTGAEQVVEGLMSLGWHQQDAVHAVQTVCADNQIETPLNAEDVPRVLKLALTSLDRGR